MGILDPEKIRDIPGWEKNAPIHICMNADYRGLAFCCKPGYSLTFGLKCKRDQILDEIGMTPQEFIKVKEEFSKENQWNSDLLCFGSLSYCCMRRGGCPRRDPALELRYPDKTQEERMRIYFQKKKELAKRILEAIKDSKGREKVKPYLKLL